MKRLYAPWRTNYTNDIAHTKNEGISEKDCIFCNQIKENQDEKYFILRRFDHSIIMLNKFPYNAGHLLILPITHLADITQLSQKARIEIWELATHCTKILKKELNAHGFNLGINIGKASGAGVPSHLHMHVLPRFIGDTNFMPTLTETKVVSVDLIEMFKKVKPHIKAIII